MTRLFILMMLMGSMFLFTQCEDDDGDGPTGLGVESITAAGTDFETGDAVEDIDLNAATAADDVPLDAVITITFSGDVDEASVTPGTIELTSGGTAATTTLATNGSVVTVTPETELQRGTDYTLNISSDIQAVGGGDLGTATSVSFTTAGRAEVEPPQTEAQVAYWAFDNNANDATGTYNATEQVDITYVEDRFGQPESAASFNGTTSIIEVPDAVPLVQTNDFTLSLWVKVDSTDHDAGHFVIGLGGANGFQFEIPSNLKNAKLAAQYDLGETSGSEDLWIDATGNVTFEGWTFSKDYAGEFAELLQDNWVHFVCVYNSETKVGSAYVNGELAKQQDFNMFPADNPKRNATGLTWAGMEPALTGALAFGFITDRASTIYDTEPWGNYASPDSNHLKGELDDVRIFHVALSEEEVTQLYDSEAP